MRIIAGTWRGRAVQAPKGEDTRPTRDRVRESIASIVFSDRGGVEGLSVLDTFAGSGAFSFELLSRGAAHATLVDGDQRAVRCIRDNAAALGAGPGRISVLRADSFTAARRGRLPGAPFDVVFLDPPYATDAGRVADLVRDLGGGGSLRQGALIVYERDARGPGIEGPGLELVSARAFGTVGVDALHWSSTEEGGIEDGPR